MIPDPIQTARDLGTQHGKAAETWWATTGKRRVGLNEDMSPQYAAEYHDPKGGGAIILTTCPIEGPNGMGCEDIPDHHLHPYHFGFDLGGRYVRWDNDGQILYAE